MLLIHNDEMPFSTPVSSLSLAVMLIDPDVEEAIMSGTQEKVNLVKEKVVTDKLPMEQSIFFVQNSFLMLGNSKSMIPFVFHMPSQSYE